MTTPFEKIDTLHGLLRVALDDAQKIDRDVYLPRGLEWHHPHSFKQCNVCLAGFVMAGHLQASQKISLSPCRYQQQTERRLLAIDALRCGKIETAFRNLHGLAKPFSFPVLSLPYSVIRDQAISVAAFKSWEDWDAAAPVYERLHDALKEAGL